MFYARYKYIIALFFICACLFVVALWVIYHKLMSMFLSFECIRIFFCILICLLDGTLW